VSPSQPTPARLTALATTRIPLVLLIGLVLLYSLLGLFGRDPWKTDDVVALATMMSAAQQGGLAWLIPHIGSTTIAEASPLPAWVGALFILAFGSWTGEIAAARFATLFWMGIACFAVWYASYLAGRRPEAQPLALPFGGEPSPAQYGRLLADISVLFLLATVGILLRTHETSQAPVLLACQALAILSALRLADKPRQSVIILSGAVAAGFLTAGFSAGLPLLVGALLVIAPRGMSLAHKARLLAGLVIALGLFVLWWLVLLALDRVAAAEWWYWNQPDWGLTFSKQHLNAIRDLSWFLWPTWPLALLGLWNWRKFIFVPHVWVPTAFGLAQLVNIFLMPSPREIDYMALAVPCAMLATFSIPTLRRAVTSALDWFALMCFSLTGLSVWFGWLAQQTGWPAQIAANIERQTVGYTGQVAWGAIAMALVISCAWIALMAWRLKLHPKAAWRGALLCAAGLTSTWILLVLLWMPTVDYVRSYRPMAHEIRLALNSLEQEDDKATCIQSAGLSIGPRASLYVFEGIEISRSESCTLIIQQTTAERLQHGIAGFDRATRTLWIGSRGADRFDRYRLLQVTPKS